MPIHTCDVVMIDITTLSIYLYSICKEGWGKGGSGDQDSEEARQEGQRGTKEAHATFLLLPENSTWRAQKRARRLGQQGTDQGKYTIALFYHPLSLALQYPHILPSLKKTWTLKKLETVHQLTNWRLSDLNWKVYALSHRKGGLLPGYFLPVSMMLSQIWLRGVSKSNRIPLWADIENKIGLFDIQNAILSALNRQYWASFKSVLIWYFSLIKLWSTERLKIKRWISIQFYQSELV